jgi:hypothetical protein
MSSAVLHTSLVEYDQSTEREGGEIIMKKTLFIAVIVAAALVSGGAVYAHMADGEWGHGPGACLGGTGGNVNVDNFKKFQKETLSLRDELATKRVELSNENNATNPDSARIGTLRKDISDLQTKIQQSAEKNGVTGWGPGQGRGQGHGQGRGYVRGPGMMYGSGYGPNGCPRW